jgi:hypothetical protein
LSGFNDIRSELVTGTSDGGGETQHLAGFGDSQNESLPIRGGGRQLHAATAENKHSARGLPFHKEGGSFGISSGSGDGRQGTDGMLWQIAEKTLFTVRTRKTIFNNFEAIRRAHRATLRE